MGQAGNNGAQLAPSTAETDSGPAPELPDLSATSDIAAGQRPGVVVDFTEPGWIVILRTGQLLAVLVAGSAVLPIGLPIDLPEPGPVLTVCTAIVLLGTGLLFAEAARRDRARPALGSAWALFAVAVIGVALIALLRSTTDGASDRLGLPAAVGLTGCFLFELAAVRLLQRGRSPRWAPSTGWDGSVIALGAAAIGIAGFELTMRFSPVDLDLGSTGLIWLPAEILLFVAALTALATAAPIPRPQLFRLAGGLTVITVTDLIGVSLTGLPALLAPMIDSPATDFDLASRLLAVTALAGYTALGVGATTGTSGRRTDRRRRPGVPNGSLAGAVVVTATVIVAAAVIDPRAPKVAAGVALLCLAVALARTRRALREVQLAGRTDPRPRTDDLTGLANRRALSEALAGDRHPGDGDPEAGWAGWAGWSDEIAVLLVDLDQFKDVNEGLGHDAGDRLLAEVGIRLRTALRPTQLLARLGGDEFAVVLPAAGADLARRVAEGLQACLLDPFEIDGSRLHVRASIGIATCHPSRGEPTDLLRQADVAMYHAKAGGTGIEAYDAERDEGGPERLRRTDELREALQRGDLEVHVQPQVDLRTGVITGAEALVRWRHPEDGVLLPDSFLPLAEHTGLMRPVAAVVLDRALEACATWWGAGFQVPVSVNLGADDLRDPELPGRVSDVLRRCELPPDALRVEITEQALLTDPAAASLVLARWRADGVAVAIDDFGTGYSSLSYLRELPIDEVKLDRAFIADLRRPTTSTIVRHTVAMAHGLWARVVAEGIEDEATARIATDLGCDVGQGLYFGAAMTTPEFIARLQAQPE